MKTTTLFLLLIATFCINNITQSQTLFYEDFNYTLGDSLNGKTNGQGSGNWGIASDNGTTMYINSSGLTFPGYSSVGKSVTIVGGTGKDVLYHKFASPQTEPFYYYSFLVSVSNTTTIGGIFTGLANTTGGNLLSRVYIRVINGVVNFGLRGVGGNPVTYGLTSFQPNTTYLCVVKYTRISGVNNDSTSLYVFKDTDSYSVEPTIAEVPNVYLAEGALSVESVVLTPDGTTSTNALNGVTIIMDGIRVGNTWMNAPLPVREKNITPISYILEQNFPNPFNPTTTINYQIPTKDFVTLKVYNLLGEEISTLVNEEKSAGVYQAKFDGSNVPSGMYFYKLTSGTFSEVKRMMLVK